jgi:type IV pilus assembly protein PilA
VSDTYLETVRTAHPGDALAPPLLVLTLRRTTMLARLQKSMKDRDQGFTLIELLVVIVIIGILAAIAIPLFLNQQKKGVDASVKSDLKSAATTVETWVVDNPSATIPTQTMVGTGGGGTASTTPTALATLSVSSGNTITLKPSTATTGGYCIFGYNAKASTATSATAQMAYLSLSGGLQSTVGAATCS